MNRTPAVLGGTPVFPAGPPAWRPDEAAVADRLRAAVERGDWNRYHGPAHDELTRRLADLIDVEHVYLCSSGTIGVELALAGLGVGEGDEVILGGYDFPGNFRAIEALGAVPVLVDLEPQGRCIDVDQVMAAAGPKTKAVIATHLHGGLVDMPRLTAWATTVGADVVEDACQAVGATVAGRPAGSWGDAGVFSFGGSKLLTAGRGGAVVARRPDVLQRMKIYAERGNQAFPLSELQAAAVLAQLDGLAIRHAARGNAVERIRSIVPSDGGLQLPEVRLANSFPAFYKLGMLVDCGRTNDRELLARALQAEGIAIDAGFRGFTQRSASRCRSLGELTVCRRAARQTLVLHHPILLEAVETVDRLSRTLLELADAVRSGQLS